MIDRKKKFVGSKSASGAAEQIVSMLPAHRVFIEPFAGRAAVTLLKAPAEFTVLIEKDLATAEALCNAMIQKFGYWVDGRYPVLWCEALKGESARHYLAASLADPPCKALVICGDAFDWLPDLSVLAPDVCVYCDPPYIKSARRDPTRNYYAHDWEYGMHERFVKWTGGDWWNSSMPNVLVSGYASDLYQAAYANWDHHSFGVGTRGGRAIEHLWTNFPLGHLPLHDSRFVGKNFTDRQRIKRKAARWLKMLKAMPAAERQAILDAIASMRS